jgi:hypothetical protein
MAGSSPAEGEPASDPYHTAFNSRAADVEYRTTWEMSSDGQKETGSKLEPGF